MQILRNRAIVDREHTTFDAKSGGSSTIATREGAAASSTVNAASIEASFSWRKMMRFMHRFIRANRERMLSEQLTVMQSNELLATYSPLAFNTDVWIQMLDPFYSGYTTWPIYNGHWKTNDSDTFSCFFVPETADYAAQVFVDLTFSADAAEDDYVLIVAAVYDIATSSWLNPIIIGAAENVAVSSGSRLIATGWVNLRLSRGQKVRFGLRQIGKSGTHATFDSGAMRVGITKAKMHPELKHP